MKITLKGNNCSKLEAYEILHKFIEKEIELVSRKEISEDTFSDPNWALHQAYLAGIKKALRKVDEFIPDQGNN